MGLPNLNQYKALDKQAFKCSSFYKKVGKSRDKGFENSEKVVISDVK